MFNRPVWLKSKQSICLGLNVHWKYWVSHENISFGCFTSVSCLDIACFYNKCCSHIDQQSGGETPREPGSGRSSYLHGETGQNTNCGRENDMQQWLLNTCGVTWGEWKRSAQCIMGRPPAAWLYSSISKRWFSLTWSSPNYKLYQESWV